MSRQAKNRCRGAPVFYALPRKLTGNRPLKHLAESQA